MILFPKQNLFILLCFIGQSPINTLVSLREVLWSVSDMHFGQSLRSIVHNLQYVLWSVSEKYCKQSPKIIYILDVPSNPKHRVDQFHALTPISCDAPCKNVIQVSLHVISCCMYATCHMQQINHTLHVKWHLMHIIIFIFIPHVSHNFTH